MLMEVAEGNLQEVVIDKPFSEVPLRTRLDIAMQVLGGLEILADAGFVHRDVKPDNILISRPGGRYLRAKIGDLGLACVTDDHATKHPAQYGRLKDDYLGFIVYMSPEAFDEKRSPMPAADVYAFGIVLFQMLFGQLPPMIAAAERRFHSPQGKANPEVSMMCKGFDIARDEFFAAALEKNADVGSEALNRLLELLRKMQAYSASERIDARRAVKELRWIVAVGDDGRGDWDRMESVLSSAKRQVLESCQRETAE
mmetsp:Transcript_5549/g.15572  ORF Transcript_5549/g.15572 Transcript_5549/m.15572 type:complete len:255 (-) Transcript_5549:81-845(-)